MPSFRAKVLDALDIHKTSIKLQVNETFPKIYSESQTAGKNSQLQGSFDATTRGPTHVPYAVSKTIINTKIGPNPVGGGCFTQSLDVLGFVVGKEIQEPSWSLTDNTNMGQAGNSSLYKNMYPITTPQTLELASPVTAAASTDSNAYSREGHAGGQDKFYTGFHYLNGLYDSSSKELKHMRKSALEPVDMQSINPSTATDHSHKDWPNNPIDQHHLLNEFPYSDALYYHSMRLSLLLTGITVPDVSEAASNHRGLVRLLIVRPRLPNIKMRWDGVANQPHINMAYPPHWDTDLFYSKRRTLGGRMEQTVHTNVENSETGAQVNHADESHLTPTFGLLKRATALPQIDNEVDSLHYGHRLPSVESPAVVADPTADPPIAAVDAVVLKDHEFTSYDVLTAPINREKYAVIVDKMVTLDTLHHGVASKRVDNIVIPFNKKIKFPGRKQFSDTQLSDSTIDEPLNLESRPVIMMLSMDQKISAQITGYTTITEC